LIAMEQVTKTYPVGGGLTVLRDVNLSIGEGEMVGILGPSGSGKSTLLHIMGLLDRPTSGRVLFQKRDISGLSDRELSHVRGRSIGFVFQSFHLVAHLSVLENVELPLFYQRASPLERRRKALDALATVGLDQRLGHRPTQLSGGESQRVAIARAVVARPSLILADEPTGNLDSHNGSEIMRILARLHAAGHTIVIITHDASVAAQVARVVRVRDGLIVAGEAS
jgi:putative ABC transport system ATP-binding protein